MAKPKPDPRIHLATTDPTRPMCGARRKVMTITSDLARVDCPACRRSPMYSAMVMASRRGE